MMEIEAAVSTPYMAWRFFVYTRQLQHECLCFLQQSQCVCRLKQQPAADSVGCFVRAHNLLTFVRVHLTTLCLAEVASVPHSHMCFRLQVREGRPLPSFMAGGSIVDTAMPQAGLQDPMTAAAAAGGASGRGTAMDTNPNMPLPLNGTHPHGAFSQHQLMQASSSQVQGVSSAAGQQQQQPMPMMRSMDSFTGSVGAPDMAAQAAAMQQQQQEPAQALPFPEGVKVVPLPVPPAAATAAAAAGAGSSGVPPPGSLNPAAPRVLGSVSQQGTMGPGSSNAVGAAFQGSVPSLQALAVREASVELSTGGAAAAAAAAAAAGGGITMPVAVPARSHVSADGGAGSLMQLAGSAGGPPSLGTSPALGGPSPALLLEDHAAAGAPGGLQAVITTSQAMVAAVGPAATAVS